MTVCCYGPDTGVDDRGPNVWPIDICHWRSTQCVLLSILIYAKAMPSAWG